MSAAETIGLATPYLGDMREVLPKLAAAGETFHTCVCDPPYDLGFMGAAWDRTNIAMRAETWRLVWDLLPPGGHLAAFGGTRTFHRMACAIEDAGFEIRDTLMWLYGTGFPKSHDVAVSIDKAARGVPHGGVDPTSPNHGRFKGGASAENRTGQGFGAGPGAFMAQQGVRRDKGSLVPDAAAWDGWGTALKPAWEPIILARKPLAGTVAANVLAHGTGALNIDGCRIHAPDAQGRAYTVKRLKPGATLNATGGNWRPEEGGAEYHGEMKPGRWPANVLHDGSEEVESAFASFGERPGQQGRAKQDDTAKTHTVYGRFARNETRHPEPRGDSGTASRFFYCSKAGAGDRVQQCRACGARWMGKRPCECDAGTRSHPTVKPISLMRWLCRMVTPGGGRILDPFAGSGTTLAAAQLKGFSSVGVELDPQHHGDIVFRLSSLLPPAVALPRAIEPPAQLALFGEVAAE